MGYARPTVTLERVSRLARFLKSVHQLGCFPLVRRPGLVELGLFEVEEHLVSISYVCFCQLEYMMQNINRPIKLLMAPGVDAVTPSPT